MATRAQFTRKPSKLPKLIDYQRYFDPITKTTCSIEVALHRLEDNRLPPPGPFNRLLGKLQGVFASATPFWR